MPITLPSTKLQGVHPRLTTAILRILTAMDALGYPMLVTDGVRTTEQQQKLYAQGRTVPGQIVTQLDGVIKRSNHQVKSDGLGHAVDCAFLVNGVASWDDKLPWSLYGAMARVQGLIWGGDWPNFKDRPHVELPKKDA